MVVKTKSSAPASDTRPPEARLSGGWLTPPLSPEQRLQRIQVMVQRITDYVAFVSKIGDLNGASAEAKEKAVAAFYEKMVVLEGQLGRIQEQLQLA
jgi:hypothetical protein